jgi:transcriptional regulator with XRE-family HTH domain
MKAKDLRAARLAGEWTQAQAASRLGISQPYYSQLESGSRPVPDELALTAVRELRLSPVTLPLPALEPRLAPLDPRELTSQLAWLSYPGFTHLQKASQPMNPAVLVAGALAHPDLDIRLVEALPWVLSTFSDLDWTWLGAQCRLGNQQNRLGYLVTLARQLAEPAAEVALTSVLSELERSRLAVEGTMCRESMSSTERTWVRQYRPTEAAHWNLLTTLTRDQLTHAA